MRMRRPHSSLGLVEEGAPLDSDEACTFLRLLLEEFSTAASMVRVCSPGSILHLRRVVGKPKKRHEAEMKLKLNQPRTTEEEGGVRIIGTFSHSLKYFYTAISDLSQGLPHYVFLGYVNNQIFIYYDSNTRKVQPRVSWMEKVKKEEPQNWDTQTQRACLNERAFRGNLETLRIAYNVSEGIHIVQGMDGCVLRGNKSNREFWKESYDGRTFLIFRKKSRVWSFRNIYPEYEISPGVPLKILSFHREINSRLNEDCIEWLEKYLSYGNETLLRTEPPVVTTVRHRTEVEDGMETHICRMDGFYPWVIDASWRRDGEVWLEDILRGSVVPNADGTYHYWLSIQIDPKERGRYRCHVEHDGLPKPVIVAIKESNLGLIISCVAAGFVLVCVIVGILVFLRRNQGI